MARMTSLSDQRGFSLLEIIVVLAILGVLATVALPNFTSYREKTLATQCMAIRRQINMDELAYYLDNNKPSLMIAENHHCRSGGTLLWLISDPKNKHYPRVGCSIHFAEIPEDIDTKNPGLDMIAGLVAGFTMDEGSGNTISLGPASAEIHGAQWVTGKSGSALHFDGKNDYAQADIEDRKGPFTVMTWVKADPVKHQKYDSVFASSADGPKKNNFQIDSDGKGNYNFFGGTGKRINIGTITNDWQLIAVSFDGANVTTYNNGKLVDTGKWNGTGEITHLAIGRNRAFNKKYTGSIDEFGLYDRAVSAEEIQAYYAATN